ncbi:MAG: hypothetical protein SGJ09_08350 [Phycisphaerae bacterium]|nr:hypothetical protein [Phycisphaerae bacterium]
MLATNAICFAIALAASTVATAADALVALYPQSYVKLADSALFGAMSLDDDFWCETFEDGLVNIPGLTLSGGTIAAPGASTDSVDADDGNVDGSGTGGRSYRANIGSPITIGISALALVGLPERAAFAWTDGPQNSTLTITITTGSGATFVRTVGPLGDANSSGATAEDRLVAITASNGIAQVVIASGGAAFEIDHVQFEDPVVREASQWNHHDFDDDGHHDDILWFNPSSGSSATWLMNGYVKEGGGALNLPVPASWVFVGAGATDNTKKTFLFWRDTATGYFSVWKLSGHEVESEGFIENVGPVSAEWQVLAIKDVDGDLDADVIFVNTVTKVVSVWIMDNHSVVSVSSIGSSAGLSYLGSGDINGDRRDDLLWRDDSGHVHGWLLNGASVWDDSLIENASAIGITWSIDAIGDLDGDGCDDLIWRNHSTGSVNAWRMAGLFRAAGGVVTSNVPLAWQLQGMSDLNGDGKDDLLWHHSSSHVVNGWQMDGLTKMSGGYIQLVSGGWSLCNY